jgi:hypothetical protein
MIKYKITFMVEDVKKPVIVTSVGYNTRDAIGKAYPILRKEYGFSDRKFDVIKVKSIGEVKKSIPIKKYEYYIDDKEMEEIREERRRMKIK